MGDPTYWYSFNQMVNERSSIYYWNALDRTYNEEGDVILQDEKRRMYVKTWIRTLKVSVYVTFFCLILGFPVAHLLANLPLRYSNLLMIFVLLPFWTSLLVRTTAWIVMLQQNGVINGVLVWLGILVMMEEFKWSIMKREHVDCHDSNIIAIYDFTIV